MKTNDKKSKPKCCNGICKTKSKHKHQNGKGDKPRPTDKSEYNKNYDNINWSKT